MAVTGDDVLTIDGRPASEALIRAGEWHDLLLVGEGLRISAPAHDVLLFTNGTLDIDSSVPVDGDRVLVQLLTTPYTESVELTIYTKEGTKTVLNPTIENGTPIVSGKHGMKKWITSRATRHLTIVGPTISVGWEVQMPNLNERPPTFKGTSKDLAMKRT